MAGNEVKVRIKGEDDFSRTFDKAQAGLGRVDKAAKSTATAFNVLKVALGPVAIALGGMQFGRMAADVLEAGDQIGKLSARLGVSAEALSEYRFVAERSGVQFNALTKSWQRFAVGIGDAVNGTGEAKDALIDLGVDAQKLAELPLDRQFEAVADAMSRVTNETERTTIAAKLFGQRGIELLQVMENGAAGIREMRQEAVEAGLSMSGEAADAAEAYADAVTDLKASFKGFSETLVLDAAPALKSLVGALKGGQDEFRDFVDEINDQESGWQKFVKLVGLDRTTGWDMFNRATGQAGDNIDRLLSLGYEMTDLDFGGQSAASLDQAADAMVRLEQSITPAAVAAKDFTDAFDLGDEVASLIDLGDTFSSTATLWGNSWGANFGGVKEGAKGMELDLSGAARGAASSIGNSIGAALVDTKRQLIDLGSIGRSVFSSLVGGLVNLGLGTAFPALAPALGLAGARASGGPVVGGSAYLVGEQGPELFVPNQAGTVVSNEAVAAGAGTYNISINAGGGGIFVDAIARRRAAEALVDEIERVQSYRGARK